MNFGENPQHDFPKMRGGQRPFGTFPKIHPFLKGQASLRFRYNIDLRKAFCRSMHHQISHLEESMKILNLDKYKKSL